MWRAALPTAGLSLFFTYAPLPKGHISYHRGSGSTHEDRGLVKNPNKCYDTINEEGGRCSLAARVREIFDEVDHQTGKFSAKTGIKYLPGCGRCWRSTKVEASSLELLP